MPHFTYNDCSDLVSLGAVDAIAPVVLKKSHGWPCLSGPKESVNNCNHSYFLNDTPVKHIGWK